MRNLSALVTVLGLALAPVFTGCATAGDDLTDTANDETSAPGSFDLWQAPDGQWHFHLVSGNGRILLTSEAYTSRTGAINGLLSTLDNGIDATMYQVVPAAHGYLIHLVASNNEVITFSQTYTTKTSANRAITSCVHAVTSYLAKVAANTSGARVEVALGGSGQFHFNLFAQSGLIVLSSEGYTTDAAAWNGAFAIQDAASVTANFSIKTSTGGSFYFTLTAGNGQVVGVSQMYTTKALAKAGIVSVQALLDKLDLL